MKDTNTFLHKKKHFDFRYFVQKQTLGDNLVKVYSILFLFISFQRFTAICNL